MILLRHKTNSKIRSSPLRTVIAILFLVLLATILIWAIQKDVKSKQLEKSLGVSLPAINFYKIELNSIDLDTQTVKGTIKYEPGYPMWEGEGHLKYYGKLSYVNLDYKYIFQTDAIDSYITKLKLGNVLSDSSFSKSYPAPIEFTGKAIGKPEMYPFDKYFIMGAVICPIYIVTGKRKKYLNIGEYSESILMNNFIKGSIIRKLRKSELDGIMSVFILFKYKEASKATYEKVEKLSKFQDRFALVMERPLYLKIMTIMFGIIALTSALYVGFKSPFKEIPLQIIGFIIGLWGIRNIMLGDLKFTLSYFDYSILLLYLLAIAGIIFRLIKGCWKEKDGLREGQSK
jgi:hypothetical protein